MHIKPVFQRLARALALGVLIIACATGPWALGQQSPTPPAYKAESPTNRGLDATLYMQTAAEYRASCYQAYTLATARVEELVKASGGNFAVVLDLDETVVDNSHFQAMLLQNGLAWDRDLWATWEEKYSAELTPIPGAKEFITKATELGAEVFYVSNRNDKFRQQAKDALTRFGIPPKDDRHLKLITDPAAPDSSNKTARFQEAERDCNCKVLLYVGDNLRDFDDNLAFDKLGLGKVKELPDEKLDDLIKARKETIDNQKGNLGKRWIILPNPTYGEWKAPLGRGESDFKRLSAADFPLPSLAPATASNGIFYLPFVIIIICFIWTLFHWPTVADLQAKDRDRFWEFLALDIRATSQYCYWYLALIGVIATIAAFNRAYFAPILHQEHLWPFGLAFLAASLSLLFIPAGYGPGGTRNLRMVWLRSVLCEQIVVVFTCYGIWEAFRVLMSTVH